MGKTPHIAWDARSAQSRTMETDNVVEWQLTAPGIWTRLPDGAAASPKQPVRAIPSLTAPAPQTKKARQPAASLVPAKSAAAVRA